MIARAERSHNPPARTIHYCSSHDPLVRTIHLLARSAYSHDPPTHTIRLLTRSACSYDPPACTIPQLARFLHTWRLLVTTIIIINLIKGHLQRDFMLGCPH
ncbi:uncharacterized protein BDZ99DRAFT_519148 [Mytilinidion resinicola]|uniref:Uncharacterized protein n=1 Tax=Mytilinidion resinicola TaxID=574789 RepID=A0A6A6YVA2_9PEZI|nr:uncharacterized protein BDZ99DRAFT_519148 [Mytilinidion resinicola]KAF2811905.1 hypothetical protein BDZ99DRAFT_519148 [Mytilinidion resinicola]